MKAYYIYMMTNRSRVVLYTGVTNDLARRAWEHQNGTIKGFTKRYRLTSLVYHETSHNIGQAIDRKKEIKGWRRRKKNALIETLNPKWTDLSPTLYQPSEIPRRASPARDDNQEECARPMKRPFRGLGAILFKEFIVVMRDPMTLFLHALPAPHRDDRVRLRAR